MKTRRENNPEAYISPKEYNKLLLGCDNSREYLILKFLWFSVRRINEMMHIRIKDIDFDRNMYRVSILKQGRKTVEEVKFFGDLKEVVEEYVMINKLGDNDYLFKGKTQKESCYKKLRKKVNKKYVPSIVCYSNHLSSRQVRNILDRLCVRVFGKEYFRGLTLHPHRFRKSFGFNIARAEIKKVGHVDKVTWSKMKLVARATRDKDFRNTLKYFDVVSEEYLDVDIAKEFKKK